MTTRKCKVIVIISVFVFEVFYLPIRVYGYMQKVHKYDPEVKISVEEAKHFNTALSTLTYQSNIPIVAEGIPLDLEIKPEEAAKFTSGHFSLVLEELCEAYDYEVVNKTASGNTPRKLRKKYSRSYDLPDVTPEECIEALSDARRLMQQLGGDVSSNRKNIIDDAFGNFSPEQLSQLASTGIPIKDLDADHYKAFSRIATYFYISSRLNTLNQCYNLLSSSNKFIVTTDSTGGKPRIVLQMKDKIGEIKRPLIGLAPGMVAVVPTPSSELPNLAILLTRSPALTIGKLISSQPDDASIVVQPSLINKSVSITGMQTMRPVTLANALADVYGLRYTSNSHGHTQIRRPISHVELSYIDLYNAVKQILPLPLISATTPIEEEKKIEQENKILLQTQSNALTDKYNMINIQVVKRDIREQRNRVFNRPGQIINECIRHIEFDYQAKAHDKIGYKASLDDLGDDARKCFAIMMMVSFISKIDSVAQNNVPDYVKDFDDVVAIAGQDKRATWVGLAQPVPGRAPTLMVKIVNFKHH